MKDKKLKILYFIPGFYYGGIETFAITMIERIDLSRFQVDILKHNNTPDETPLLEKITNFGGNVYNLPPFRISHIVSYIKASLSFLRAHSDYQVIHCHSLVHSFFLLLFAKRINVPIRILHSHTTHWDEGWLRCTMGKIFRTLSLPLATDYLACSDLAAIWGFGQNEYQTGKIKILHNGIDLNRFKFNSTQRDKIRTENHLSDKIVIGHVGRMTTAKNGRFLMEIIQEAIHKNSNVIFMQLGDGPDLPELKIYAQELGIAKQVIFMGKKEDVSNYYSAFDVFLLPSLWEGAPVCAIEAQANGLPCILSDVITKEVNICKDVHYVSLQSPKSQWVDAISDCCGKRNESSIAIKQLTEAGYNRESPVHVLEKLYTHNE